MGKSFVTLNNPRDIYRNRRLCDHPATSASCACYLNSRTWVKDAVTVEIEERKKEYVFNLVNGDFVTIET